MDGFYVHEVYILKDCYQKLFEALEIIVNCNLEQKPKENNDVVIELSYFNFGKYILICGEFLNS